MLTLHGFAFSNYHNIVKHALMYKGIPFEEHIVYPGTPELLAVNPAGKVPAMTTEDGTSLAESSVLVDYLEDAYPAVPLYPAEPEARARVRQLMKVSELYLDLPSRRLLPAVLGNAAIDQAVKDEVRTAVCAPSMSWRASPPTWRVPRYHWPTSTCATPWQSRRWWVRASWTGTSWRKWMAWRAGMR